MNIILKRSPVFSSTKHFLNIYKLGYSVLSHFPLCQCTVIVVLIVWRSESEIVFLTVLLKCDFDFSIIYDNALQAARCSRRFVIKLSLTKGLLLGKYNPTGEMVAGAVRQLTTRNTCNRKIQACLSVPSPTQNASCIQDYLLCLIKYKNERLHKPVLIFLWQIKRRTKWAFFRHLLRTHYIAIK